MVFVFEAGMVRDGSVASSSTFVVVLVDGVGAVAAGEAGTDDISDEARMQSQLSSELADAISTKGTMGGTVGGAIRWTWSRCLGRVAGASPPITLVVP